MVETKITDGSTERTVVFTGSDSPSITEVCRRVLNQTKDETLAFINSVDARIVVDIADSSWVEAVEFAPLSGELIFVAADGARINLKGSFDTFKRAITAPSVGKFYWNLKRAQ